LEIKVILLWKTLSDLKEPAILIRLFIPFAVGLVLVSLLGYGLFGIFLTSEIVINSPIVQDFNYWEEQAQNTIGAIPLIGGVILWFIGFAAVIIAGVLGIILGSYLVLLFAMIIVSFMTESIVKVIHDKHYPDTPYQGHGTTLGMFWKLAKFGLLILLVLLLTLPLLFIPLINIVWFWLLGFLFFRYAIILDVGQIILPEKMFSELKGVTNWEPSTAVAILFALSVFPVMSFFAPVLAVIALSHYCFEQLALEQKKTPKG